MGACLTMENKPKPPTQGVGVSGFKSDVYANDEVKIRWHDLIHIPKFQMYALETSGGAYGNCGNVMEWIMGFIQDKVRSHNELDFFNDYVKWHDLKNYWPKEDVYGTLIEDEVV